MNLINDKVCFNIGYIRYIMNSPLNLLFDVFQDFFSFDPLSPRGGDNWEISAESQFKRNREFSTMCYFYFVPYICKNKNIAVKKRNIV